MNIKSDKTESQRNQPITALNHKLHCLYLNPLLKKHNQGLAITFEDLVQSWEYVQQEIIDFKKQNQPHHHHHQQQHNTSRENAIQIVVSKIKEIHEALLKDYQTIAKEYYTSFLHSYEPPSPPLPTTTSPLPSVGLGHTPNTSVNHEHNMDVQQTYIRNEIHKLKSNHLIQNWILDAHIKNEVLDEPLQKLLSQHFQKCCLGHTRTSRGTGIGGGGGSCSGSSYQKLQSRSWNGDGTTSSTMNGNGVPKSANINAQEEIKDDKIDDERSGVKKEHCRLENKQQLLQKQMGVVAVAGNERTNNDNDRSHIGKVASTIVQNEKRGSNLSTTPDATTIVTNENANKDKKDVKMKVEHTKNDDDRKVIRPIDDNEVEIDNNIDEDDEEDVGGDDNDDVVVLEDENEEDETDVVEEVDIDEEDEEEIDEGENNDDDDDDDDNEKDEKDEKDENENDPQVDEEDNNTANEKDEGTGVSSQTRTRSTTNNKTRNAMKQTSTKTTATASTSTTTTVATTSGRKQSNQQQQTRMKPLSSKQRKNPPRGRQQLQQPQQSQSTSQQGQSQPQQSNKRKKATGGGGASNTNGGGRGRKMARTGNRRRRGGGRGGG